MPDRRSRADVGVWAVAIIAGSRSEFNQLFAQLPADECEAVGTLRAWSTKDEIAHLAYWIALFATNIAAARAGQPLTDTSPYLEMNDVAWHERKQWSWARVTHALLAALDAVETQIAMLSAAELRDGSRLTVESTRQPPRALIRSLLYELIDHPVHHLTGIYERLGAHESRDDMCARLASLVEQPGVRTLAASTRAKLRGYGWS